jgi:hypothetical protein
MTVYLRPARPTPGSRFEAEIVLLSRSETPIDGVEAHLVGFEQRHARTAAVGDAPVPEYAGYRHVDLVARTPKKLLVPGEHRFTFAFDIPPSAPPAYRSRTARVLYDLHVRVDIPWWPDRTGRYLVPVDATPSPGGGTPPVFCTDARGPQGTALYAEASLDAGSIPIGGVLRGAVSLANVAHHRVRRVELSLVQMESTPGPGLNGVEGHRYELHLHEGPPAEQQPIPFKVRLPDDASTSFRGALLEVRWLLEIRAVIALGSDVTLTVPFRVHRPDRSAEVTGAPATRVPPVGRARRALIWAESARRNGLANDAEEERMSLSLGDAMPVSLSITLEPHKSGGLALTAAVTWPGLGIDLAVTERRWVDAWSNGACPIDVPRFAERFTARGREADQVRAVLDAATCRWLLRFDEAALGDEGATLVSTTTAQTIEVLDAFVARAVGAARALADAVERVPPPAAMAGYVPAWRAFASTLGGRLSVGDMAIREAQFDESSLSIVTEWGDDGAARCTTIRFPRAARRGAPLEDPQPTALDGQAKGVLESLRPQVTSIDVGNRAVKARLPAPVADPATLEPILAGMGRLTRLLAGGGARGPYR